MSKFIYQIEKREQENNIELLFYIVDKDNNTKLEKIEVPYTILAKKEDFETLNIKSDKIILSKQNFINKNNEKIVEIQVKNKDLYDYVKESLREGEFSRYEADLIEEHKILINNKIPIQFDNKFDINTIANNINLIDKPTLKYVSLDIETIGEMESLEIIMISTYSPFASYMSKVYVNCDKLDSKYKNGGSIGKFEEFEVIYVDNEKQLLEQFKQDIIEFEPQLIIGWNVIDFDFKVIKERFKVYSIEFKLSKFEGDCKLRIRKDFFQDSTLVCPGVLVFDGIQLLKSNFIVYEDYKLNTVAKEVIGDEKIDLQEDDESGFEDKVLEITNLLKNNPRKLIEYNFKDSLLVSQIISKLSLLELMYTRSIVTETPLLKVKSPIATLDIMYLKKLHERGIVGESNFNYSESGQIEGAFVLEPKRGFYEDIFVLDFKSLYPSIIMTFNIDPYTYSNNGKIIAPNGAKFSSKLGILPELILTLYKERDVAKKDKDDIKSYALKTTMNSFYGAMASPKSRFHNREVGGAITAFGRFILQKAQKFVQDKGHSTVIYGDSVTSDTNIWIRKKGSYNQRRIEIKELFEFEGEEYSQKQPDGTQKYYKKFDYLETLTMSDDYVNVWKPLNYVMKHKTSKKVYELEFNNQCKIKVTEDHSLIDYELKEGLKQIKPQDASKGIYNYGFEGVKKSKDKNILAEFLGFWIGDGYLDNNGFNIGISTGLDKDEFIDKIISKLSLLQNTKIYDKGKGDINFSNVELYEIMKQIGFKSEWTSKTKRIPRYIFSQDNDFIFSFLRGLFSADGTIINKEEHSMIRYTSVNLKLIEDIKDLLFKIGIGSSYFKENNQNKFKDKVSLTYSYHLVIIGKKSNFFMENVGFIFDRKNEKYIFKEKNKKVVIKPIKNKKVIFENYNDFVYDISVDEFNRFYGNDILLKNTDSIFVKIKGLQDKSLDQKKTLGFELEKQLNSYFKEWVEKEFGQKSYLDIEMEKIYSKFFIASKKRYVGFDELSSKTKFVGMEAVRGDWTDLARSFQVNLVNLIFKNASKEEIEKFILDEVDLLKKGGRDELLVYKKKITKPLADYVKMTPPHVKAAREVKDFSGRLVKYVMGGNGPKHISLINDNFDYDYEHYIDKQLKGVSDDLLECLEIDFDEVLGSKKQKSLDRFF